MSTGSVTRDGVESVRYPKKARFWLSLLSTALQVAVIISVALWLLPSIDVDVAWPVIAGLCLLVVGWDVFTFIMGTRALDSDVVRDLETMVGQTGLAATDLNPSGQVRLRGELWAARSIEGCLSSGTRVEVVGQCGLSLEVRPKAK